MAIDSQKVFEGITEYICEIWGKKRKIYYARYEGEVDCFIIENNFENRCPKCETPYSQPEHGDKIVCSHCHAEFEFFGALHPQPIGATRREVEQALGWR